MTRLLLAALLLAGCAAAPLPAAHPAAVCDARMVDHNRRNCEQRGGMYQAPEPGVPSCGKCVTTSTRDPGLLPLCITTGWSTTCIEEMPTR